MTGVQTCALPICSGNLSWRIGEFALISATGSWLPELQEIARKYAGRVAVVSISQDPKPVWKEFIAEKRLLGNQWNELVDGDTRLGMRYGVKEIPHFVLIAPDGRIQDVW